MTRVGFVLLPGPGLLPLAGALDALQLANQVLDAPAYEPLLLSPQGGPVAAATATTMATRALHEAGALDAVFVVADALPATQQQWQAPWLGWLQQHAAAGATLGGIGAGAGWLAEAGLLAGHRATVHWPHIGPLVERHPDVLVSQRLYEIDRNRLSCAGHQAARDLFIAWLGQRHGERLALELAAAFGLERLRRPDERQRVPVAARLGTGSAKLAEAVALMEANLSEPLPTEDIARLVGVSRRQLERLFRQHLDALPSRWYLALRLERARRLLRQTPQSVLQIGLGCGFASGPHFSNAYRAHFGHTPRDERARHAAPWSARSEAAATAPPDPATLHNGDRA